MSSRRSESVLIEAPCRLEAVRDAARSLRSFLDGNGIAQSELDEWELVTVEAGNNSVSYATPEAEKHPVKFLMHVWPEAVELHVSDRSPTFTPPEQASLPPDDSEHGRGLFLLSALTDSMRYVRGEDENFLVLRRGRRTGRRPITDSLRDDDLEKTLQAMAEDLGASHESLSAIFRFSDDLGRSGDTVGCAAKWLEEVLRVVHADWYVLRQLDIKSGSLKPICAQKGDHRVESQAVIGPDHNPNTRSVELQAAVSGRDQIFDERNSPGQIQSLTEIFGAEVSGIAHPIFVGTQIFGVLTIGVNRPRADFTQGQVNVIHTFADFLGLQLCNDQIQQEAIHARLVTRELQVAAGIQRSLLPKQLPKFEGYGIAAYSQSARAVGGDFYDVMESGRDGALLTIADVMGKGVPAAMFAAIFRSHLRASLKLMRNPARMLDWLNYALFSDLDGVDMFVTAQLAYFDFVNRNITVASAGHYPALLIQGAEQNLIEVCGDGPPLGISRNPVFEEQKVDLVSPSRLLMLTDGLFEARDPHGRTLGHHAISRCFRECATRHADANATSDALRKLTARHQGGTAPSDDITFLLLVENH